MRLQQLLQINLKLIPTKGLTHSLIQAACRSHLFDNKADTAVLVNAFHESICNEQYFPQLLDWVNLFLFNVTAINQQRITHYENQFLESTEDAQSLQKSNKMHHSSITNQIKQALKQWLQQILALPFFQKIFAEAKPKSISKSKSLRSLLETIDYLTSKYQVKITQKENISTLLSAIDRNTERTFVLQRANQVNRRVFSGGEELVTFIQEIAANYTANLPQIAALISANYLNPSPPRKYFEATHNSGEVIAEQMMDFLIRTMGKGDLFSQKMDSYRPFELLMEVFLQEFSYALVQFNEIIESVINSSIPSIYSNEHHKKIQSIAGFLSYQLENNYPRLHHLLQYTYESLLAKYTPTDSLELIKKLILNRLFLNPFYYALLHSPSEHQIEKYVKIANQLRILFYEKKVSTIPETSKSERLVQLAQLLRKSLNGLVTSKDKQVISATRVYINDTILGSLFCEISDSLKLNPNRNSSELHSESSLSFSLRNESASRMQHPPSHNYIPTNQSFPHLPKPSHRTVTADRNQSHAHSSQRETSKIISTELHIESKSPPAPIERLQELIALRREYGQLQRLLQIRTLQHSKGREKWRVNLQYANSPISRMRQQLQAQSKQLQVHSFLL